MSTNIGKIIPVAVAVLGITAVAVTPTFAATSAAGNADVTVNVGKTISIFTPFSATINANPDGTEATSTITQASVQTNSENGYKLKLGMKSGVAENSLVHSSDSNAKFTANSAAQDSLAEGTWGFKQTTGKWNPVPLAGAEVELTTPTNGATGATEITFGAKASTSQKSGTYTNQVTYTATVNS